MPNVSANLDQLFQGAAQHQRAGRLAEAEQLYRQVLARQPNHSDALHMLGVLAAQVGRKEIAVNLIRQAIALRPDFAEAYSNLSIALHDNGQLDEAIAVCRQAIALRPNFPEAHNNLGNSLNDDGQLDQAIAAYRQAITLKPNYPEAHNNLGSALKEKGRLDEAIAAYRQAIALSPNYPEAHCNLGIALQGKGQLDEAIAAYRQAIALRSNLPEAHNNLGNSLKDKGQLDQAIAAYRQAIALRPNLAQAHSNLGIALKDKGRLDEAIAAYRQAIALRPDYPEAHSNLGIALKEKGQVDEAIAACRQAIVLRSKFPEAHNNLGIALKEKGRLDEAIAAYRQAIVLKPDVPEAHDNLGNALKDSGQLDQAIAAYRQAIALRPDYPEAHSNLVYTLHFHPDYDAQAIHQEHRRWNQQHAHPLRHLMEPHPNDRCPGRRLRIGYVSPDFRNHAQSFFTIPVFEKHDHAMFEIHCYSSVVTPDGRTERIRKCADVWRDVRGESDAALAQIIRADRIDILVDLTMHMANNRALLFARKPAPVQVCWLAYPGSTGLTAMDYRLSDPYLDPPGMDESVYSEQTIRLPHSFWCYDPLDGRAISCNSLPALDRGIVTFGCFNSFFKITPSTLRLWADLLRALNDARLLILANPGSPRQQTLDTFRSLGVDPNRIDFVPTQNRGDYLCTYHRVDIGLDPIPCPGHTTTLDALWMGVPVVTLQGNTAITRGGTSILTNVNLPELIAKDADDYVRVAVDLAKDLPRLKELRSKLRERMQQSPLMDAPRFAGDIEAAYRQMWRTWCSSM